MYNIYTNTLQTLICSTFRNRKFVNGLLRCSFTCFRFIDRTGKNMVVWI